MAGNPRARSLRALALTIVPGSFCMGAPVLAETRAGVDVAVSGRVSTNPFLELDGDTGVAGELQIDPWLQMVDEESTVNLRGSFIGSAYTGGNGTDRSALVAVDASKRVSPYMNVRGGANYQNTNRGVHSNLLYRTGAADDVPLPVNPIPDTSIYGLRTRMEMINANAGLTFRPSARDSIDLDVGASRVRYKPLIGSDYDSYSGSIGYARQLSPRTSLTASVLLVKPDYVGTWVGDGTIVTPRVGIQQQLSSTLSATVNAGASFVRTRRVDGGTDKFTTFAGDMRLCKRGEDAVWCLAAARSAQPRALGGVTTVTSFDLSYDSRISRKDSLSLTARYSRNDDSRATGQPFIGQDVQFYGASGTLTHNFNQRFMAFVSPSYSRITERSRPDLDNFQLSVGLRYRFGDVT